MEEKWTDVVGYEGDYIISNYGKIISCKFNKKKVMKPILRRANYYAIGLSKNGKQKDFFIHRLVAIAFIGVHNEYNIINHKDGDSMNNYVDNLERCTQSYNCKHAYSVLGRSPTKHWTGKFGKEHHRSTPIEQYAKEGEYITTYDGMQDAMRATGVHSANICSCCKGNLKSAGGYNREYKTIL